MKTLNGFKSLSKEELKKIVGGTKPTPPNCSCFCYVNNVKVSNPCTTYCPDGSVPGANPGWTPACGTPPPLN